MITDAEYDQMGTLAIFAWLIRKRGILGLDWQVLEKSGGFDGQRHIDIYKIQSRSGVTETFYFDVTESWGRFSLWNLRHFMLPVADPQGLREYSGALGDDGLREALGQGPFAFHSYAWCVLSREATRRGLEVPEASVEDLALDPTNAAEEPIPEDETSDEIDAALRKEETISAVSLLLVLGGIVMTIAFVATQTLGAGYFWSFGAIVYGVVGMARSEKRVKGLKRARAAVTEVDGREGAGVDRG